VSYGSSGVAVFLVIAVAVLLALPNALAEFDAPDGGAWWRAVLHVVLDMMELFF
jgi:hypothetical protein